jgi:hypothetical protein
LAIVVDWRGRRGRLEGERRSFYSCTVEGMRFHLDRIALRSIGSDLGILEQSQREVSTVDDSCGKFIKKQDCTWAILGRIDKV